jgi:hypothetical protein
MPHTSATYVGIAFRLGDTRNSGDLLVMSASGGPFVHSEFFLQKGGSTRFYTAVDQKQHGGFLPTSRRLPLPRDWEVIRYPVTQQGYSAAYALILQMLSMHIPYNSRDLWQCCFQLLLPFEQDLSWDQLGAWSHQGVFCSQACLLLLRRLCSQGVVSLPRRTTELIASTNSRGCSPNELHRMLTGWRLTEKKEGRNMACGIRSRCCRHKPA